VHIPIPKCASQSIKKKYSLTPEKLRHDAQILSDVSRYKEGFVVLREPIDRFKSLVRHYFLVNEKGPGTKLLGHHDASTIVEVVLRNFSHLESVGGAYHWFTQKSFIPEAFYELEDPRFYDMEWLRKNCNVTNTSPSSSVKVSAEQREEILKIYAEDVILYERYIGPILPCCTQ